MSTFVVDLRESSSPWRHEQDVLEINGEGFTASDAIRLVNQYPSAHHFVQQMIDACLIKQVMRAGSFEATSFEQFRNAVVESRFDAWWAANKIELSTLTLAWMSLTPSAEVPLRVLVGNLASNPSAAIVSARCEGRRGAFVESTLKDLPSDFAPLRNTEIGAVIPLQFDTAAIGMVIDRALPVLDEETKNAVAGDVFHEWLTEQRSAARVRWLWRADESLSRNA